MKKGRTKWLLMLALVTVFICAGAMTAYAKEKLETVTGLWWDDETAKWDEVENAYQYEVFLYRDGSRVATKKVKRLRCVFSDKITVAGDYSFRVRALAKGSEYTTSDYSEYSETISLEDEYFVDRKVHMPEETVNVTANQKLKEPGAGLVSGEWKLDEKGYWYLRVDGSWPYNMWFQDPDTQIWYYFDYSGYMKTGWIDWKGNRYYCAPNGAMLTGTQVIDGTTYNFAADGSLIR